MRGLLRHAVEEDQGGNEKCAASDPDHAGDDADDHAQGKATADGERSHAVAFSGSFHGMRPRIEAIMQVSLTPA